MKKSSPGDQVEVVTMVKDVEVVAVVVAVVVVAVAVDVVELIADVLCFL